MDLSMTYAEALNMLANDIEGVIEEQNSNAIKMIERSLIEAREKIETGSPEERQVMSEIGIPNLLRIERKMKAAAKAFTATK